MRKTLKIIFWGATAGLSVLAVYHSMGAPDLKTQAEIERAQAIRDLHEGERGANIPAD